MAEKTAWKMAENSHWDLIVLNPGFVLGPSLSTRIDGASVDMMRSLLNGKYRLGVPDIYLAFVDVRDVAQAHFLAALDAIIIAWIWKLFLAVNFSTICRKFTQAR